MLMTVACIVSDIWRSNYLYTHYASLYFVHYAALILYFDASPLKCKLLYSEIIILLCII